MTNENDSLLREVDEELRREQLEKLWERYNGLILGAAALIVLLVGGYKFMESRRIAAAQAAGETYTNAVKLLIDKKADEAGKALQSIATSGPKGYAVLAKLQIAGADIKAGNAAEALAVFDDLVKDPGADSLLKSYAQLQAASLRMGEADFTEMQNRLNSLTEEASPFKNTARELLGLAAYKAGNLEEARKLLEPLLIDPNASQGLQERIKVLMQGIAAAELAKTAPAASAVPAAAPAAAPGGAAPGEAGSATPPATAAPDNAEKK